jgi:hypothetical protein
MMSGLPSGLQRRLLPTYLFPVVCFATELVVVGAPAWGWGLGLADRRLLEADLRPGAILQLGLLERWHKRCRRYASVVPSLRASWESWWRLLFFLPSWVLLGQHTVGANFGKQKVPSI